MLSPARRLLLKAGFAHVAVGALGLSAFRALEAGAQSAAKSVALRDDLHVLTVGGSNVVAMTGPDGVLLVDGCSPGASPELLEMIAGLPGSGAARTLFNTCWHRERIGLNETLGRAGATIIAHANTRLWLTTDVTWPWNGQTFARLPEVARPNKTFYDRDKLAVGDTHVQYGHVRASPHTDGDMYVFFADANVLAVGDAVSGDGWPSIDWWTGGWIGGVVAALESFLVLADAQTRIVPARGPVLNRADLEAQFEMYDVIYERLADLFYSAKSPDEAVAARPTSEFDRKMGQPDEFVRQAFRSLWGFLSPDA